MTATSYMSVPPAVECARRCTSNRNAMGRDNWEIEGVRLLPTNPLSLQVDIEGVVTRLDSDLQAAGFRSAIFFGDGRSR